MGTQKANNGPALPKVCKCKNFYFDWALTRLLKIDLSNVDYKTLCPFDTFAILNVEYCVNLPE